MVFNTTKNMNPAVKEVYCAVDLGATSGRIIISSNGESLEEIRRFPNQVYESGGRWFWDTDRLFDEIQAGLRLLAKRNDVHVRSIGVDTWGVDVVFIGEDGRALAHPRAYRDPYTNGIPGKFFSVMPREEVYRITGIQTLPFNTIFQFYACLQEGYEPFLKADKYLFIPDYISYRLTGNMVCEYTILSTSSLTNAGTRTPDEGLVRACGAKPEAFPVIVNPGHRTGLLDRRIADFGYDVPVVAVAGHDTASAVATVPIMHGGIHTAYLSSGTWSLMGIVTDSPVITADSQRLNFTNEGGVGGTFRLLKNITGMWILEQCRRQWSAQGRDYTHAQLVEMAQGVSCCPDLFDPDEPRFANPADMLHEVSGGRRLTDAETVCCIFRSLARRYGQVFGMLRQLAPWQIGSLCIIGGGARNAFLNSLTEEAVGVPVFTGPVEATALGNIRVQKAADRQD